MNAFLGRYPDSRALIMINMHSSEDYGWVVWNTEPGNHLQAEVSQVRIPPTA